MAKRLSGQNGWVDNMAFLALNLHYAPGLASLNIRQKLIYTGKRLLNINVRHDSLVKILYFVVGGFHAQNGSTSVMIEQPHNMRQKPKSKAVDFQSAEGGAVPTLAHQTN